MKYKAIIWGCGREYKALSGSIFREVEKGSLEIIGITSLDSIYKSIDGVPFIEKEELQHLDFDFIITTIDHRVLPDIYHEAESYGITRERFIKGNVFSDINFDLQKYMKLRENPVSIISQICFGGFLYHRLNLPFSSPTVNLFFNAPDFITLCKALPEYMEADLVFERMNYEKGLRCDYPVMKCKDISVHFNHYKTVGEATEKWYKRREKINYENIMAVMMAEKPESLTGFEGIPYRKVCFTSFHTDAPDTVYLPLEKGKQYWQMFNGSATGMVQSIDPLKFMLGEPDFLRCVYK